VIRGSCLCGRVAFEATQLASPIGHCHCNVCRKAHGAAFATTARVARDDFRWVRGGDVVKHIESSPGKLRHFCGDCGTHLMAERLDQSTVILRLGGLDEDPGVRPSLHIWMSDAKPWLEYGAGLPQYSGGGGSERVDVGMLDTLRELEVRLHEPAVRGDPEQLGALLHPAFREFGRSGAQYSRDATLAEFVDVAQPYRIWSQDFVAEPLAEGLVLLTYRSAHVDDAGGLDRHTLRTSLWQRTDHGWQLRFHQGTPTEPFTKAD
jgi:hypothetical protein